MTSVPAAPVNGPSNLLDAHRSALDACLLLRGFDAPDRARLCSFLEVRSFKAGSTLVLEGARDEELYVVLTGTARLKRNGIELSDVPAGDYFGELALVSHSSRAASIHAVTDVQAAVLSPAEYARMAQEAPALARHLLERMIAGLGHRLTDMTDNVRLLLKERSLPRRASLAITLDGEVRHVRTGTRLKDLLPKRKNGFKVVAALLGGKPVSLLTALGSECSVACFTNETLEGQRIYQQSLTLLMLEAGAKVSPGLELRVRDSLGGASRMEVHGVPDLELPALAQAIQAEMMRLAHLDHPLRQEWWTVDEAVEHFRKEAWRDEVDLLRTWRQAAVPVVSYGTVHVLQSSPLLPSTGELTDLRVLAMGDELILVDQPEKLERFEHPGAHELRGPSAQERWLRALGITNVGAFNRACIDGDVAQMIRVSEGFHEKRMGHIADEITARADRVMVVGIAGPSSSGKTTFIKRLKVQLQVEGINPISLSLDDYYLDRDKTPRDAQGDFDYEVLEALDLPLLRDHLLRMMRGETVKTARFDFKAGRSIPDGGPEVTLGPQEVLMMEGIHGLNPALFTPPSPDMIFRVFVCPRAQLAFDRVTRIHASDLRLVRRIVRDRHGRGTSAHDNIMRWPSVRNGERAHIFPFESFADATFDSSLIYELSVLKVYAERYLLEVPHEHPAYAVAFRLLALLDRFVTTYPDHVPPTSFLREFIGGSGFEY